MPLRVKIFVTMPLLFVVQILTKKGYLPVPEFESTLIDFIAKTGTYIIYVGIIFLFLIWIFSPLFKKNDTK